MKLYTEEQVNLAFLRGHSLGGLGVKFTSEIVEDMRKELTPIELPSDEEIDNYARQSGLVHPFVERGAKWMRDKIQGGNK